MQLGNENLTHCSLCG